MLRIVSLSLPVLLTSLTLGGCVLTKHPQTKASVAETTAPDWETLLAEPGPIVLTSKASAYWSVPLKGLLNLDHPTAEEAGLENVETPIVLPVHFLAHPDAGLYVIDSGVSAGVAAGEPEAISGPISKWLDGMEPVASLSALLAEQEQPLKGVLITHAHLDHILGLPDVASEVPVYMGPGELDAKSPLNSMMRKTYNGTFEGLGPVQVWDFETAPAADPFQAAIDLLGDGSLWALFTPGHTSGSTSYLARTVDGPVLFTGDACHTLWGWQNDVESGTYNVDPDSARDSFERLKAFAESHPSLRVFVGHELDGENTGVDDAMSATSED